MAGEVGLNAHARLRVRQCDHRCLAYHRMLVQAGLDLSQFDAVTTAFDHPVAASKEDVVAVGWLDDDIPCAIPARSLGVDQKGSSSVFGKVPIPLHDTRAR